VRGAGAAFFHLAAVAGVGAAAWLVVRDLSYYALPASARPYHGGHAVLRSSGDAGLLYGLAGSGLFVLNLAYLVRKRLASWKWLGSLRTWIAFHVFSGIVGAALILLHSALLPRSALGIYALACLAVVVLSGLVGRYIHAHVPRTVEGWEMESGELRKRLLDYRGRLEAAGLPAGILDHAQDDVPRRRSTLARLWGVLAGDREVRRTYRRLKDAVRSHAALKPLAGRVLPLARRYCQDRQRLARYGELRGLMSSWRFLHRWLAVVMIAVVLFHVGVALRFGDLRLPEALR
jgi:hypothetical protein